MAKSEAGKKDKTTKRKTSAKVQKLIEDVEKLSVLELAELVKALENKFGVSPMAAAPMAAAPQTSAEAGGAPAGEEKSEFTVTLESGGANKIAVIKVVREIKPDLGLKEAKELVEAAPKELLSGVKKEEAENAKKKLEEAGAQVGVK